MAAMTGLESSMRVTPSGPSPSVLICGISEPFATALRSKPEQKVPLLPFRTAIARVSSPSNSRNARAKAIAVGASSAFLTSGRLMVTTSVVPRLSVMMVCCSSSLLLPALDIAIPFLFCLLTEQFPVLSPDLWSSVLANILNRNGQCDHERSINVLRDLYCSIQMQEYLYGDRRVDTHPLSPRKLMCYTFSINSKSE